MASKWLQQECTWYGSAGWLCNLHGAVPAAQAAGHAALTCTCTVSRQGSIGLRPGPKALNE